ncbi:dUTP diphosphatase [bacterium DOLZORAL124_38_8]|nr:MAG: dUTP diphosphatase [bacterium DOLZORAL124_38_8]
MNVNITRIDQTLPLPKYETAGSFAFDFLARTTVSIAPQELALIPGNVIIECPKNLALQILPRSSTFRKTGLIFPHSIGLIDADYCGPNDEIMIQVFNLGKETVTINRGERIAQGLFVSTQPVAFHEINQSELKTHSRGGFGSTDQA